MCNLRTRGLRRSKTERIIAKRKKQAKFLGINPKTDHKLSKTNPFTCGDSSCAMCGNPRKFFNEKTLQEKIADEYNWED